MFVGTVKIYLHADWPHSLKEKRMIVRSIVDRIKNNFNVSIAEVESLNDHKNIVIGLACVNSDKRYLDSTIQKIINFVEDNCEAEVIDVVGEIF